MTILALDASGPAGSVALVRDAELLYEAVLIKARAHAAHLAPMASAALDAFSLTVGDCDAIACIVGPGSFTGVRIGASLAQGMALAADLPCAAVNALEAWAYPHRFGDRLICPLLDARAGQVYAAAFRAGERLLPDAALPLEDFLAQVRALSDHFLFVGDGVRAYGAAIQEALGQGAQLDAGAVLRASSAAFLAEQAQGSWSDPAQLAPLYLRAPQAERERMTREHG